MPAQSKPTFLAAARAGELIECSEELHERLDQLVELIKGEQRFLIVSHTSPDGDAIGSTLALALLLREQGKEVVAYNRDPIPYNFQFLPGSETWSTDIAEDAEFDVTVMLDCAEPSRIGEEFPAQGWGTRVVVIDHHKTWDQEFAELYIRDVNAAATGELLYRLVSRFGVISRDIAKNLYCCLMTDTGSFRYSNTSRTAFRIAGELVELGVDPWEMTSHIYESQPRERLDLLCQVLGTLSLSACGRLAFLRVERSMLEGLNGEGDLTDGFINYARSIQGVEVATQLKEADEGRWRVSFRSRGLVDVSALAERFGGGGHFNAAGCTIQAEPEQIEGMLSQALIELLGRR